MLFPKILAISGYVCAFLAALPTFAQLDSVTRGVADSHAVINFSDLASQQQERQSLDEPRNIHPPQFPGGDFWLKRSIETAIAGDAAFFPEEPLVSAFSATSLSPAPAVDFQGMPDTLNVIPPDTHGAVGPNHLVVALNAGVRIQNRDGSVRSTVTLDTFWRQVGPFTRSTFDPKVYYDAAAGRWIMVACADAFLPSNSVLIGVSQTSDPTGNWNLYRYDGDAQDVIWADYPSVGYNGKWIVVSMNMFYNDLSGYKGSHLWVFDKADLYARGQGRFTLFQDNSGFTQVPAVTLDPNEQNMYIVETFGQRTLRISTVTGNVGTESFNVGSAIVTSPNGWSLVGGQIGPQKDSNQLVDTGDTRMHHVVMRGGSLWCTHTVFLPETNPNRSAVQWWQLNVNGTILQQGRIDDRTGQKFYAYPSLAVNRNFDVMLGYSRYGRDQYVSANYSFRFATDPINTMQADRVFKAGEGPYFKDFGSGRNRWGDYSATVVDPLNDINMWTIQEYAMAPTGSTSRWGTWWAMINLLEPPDGNLEVFIQPVNETSIIAGQGTNITVRVTDVFPVTNATVSATVQGLGVLQFRNDGVDPDQVRSNEVYTATLFAPQTPGRLSLDIFVNAPGKNPFSTNIVYNTFALPGNDMFTNAFKIPAEGAFGNNIITGTTHFATLELPMEPRHAGATNLTGSLWWNWSSPVTTSVLIDTAGSGADTVVAVYTGNSLNALTEIVSADDHVLANGTLRSQAHVRFTAQAGVTYRIAIATKNSTGDIRLRLQPNGQLDLTPPIITVDFPPSGLVSEVQQVEIRGTSRDPEPNASGVRAVLVDNLNVRPRSAVTATGTTNWSVTINLEEGTNVFHAFAVDFSNNRSEEQTITVYYRRPEVPNDLFANAIALGGPNGTVMATNILANKEFREPAHAGNEGGKSVWWRITPAESGILLLSTEGSTNNNGRPLDTLLAVYQGRFVNDLTLVASNDDAPGGQGHSELTASLNANTTYFIAVDSYAGSSGVIRLSYAFQTSVIHQVNAAPENPAFGTVSPASGLYPRNSAVTVTATPAPYYEFDSFVTTRGTLVSTNNPYSFLLTGDTELRARFRLKQFDEDFEGEFPKAAWVNSGFALIDLVRPGVPGTKAAVSTAHGDRQSNSLIVITNLAPGFGSFEFRVSTERDYDKLEFYINNDLIEQWSGEVGWSSYTFNIPAPGGQTKLEWRYVKDNALSEGEDRVYLDNIDLPVGPALPAQRPTITAITKSGVISATGVPNRTYLIEASQNLVNWIPVAERVAGSNGQFTFSEAQPLPTMRFYRLVER